MELMDNIFQYHSKIDKKSREALLKQDSFVIWFTGLSASGKSSIGNNLEYFLYRQGYLTFMLDGDNVRFGLNSDLGFSDSDRKENIRRVAHVAKLLMEAGIIVIVTFISPFIKDRQLARELVGQENFIEIFVDCPIDICMQRDLKGLYKKALNDEIKDFTGVSSPYERPENPHITIDSGKMSVEQATEYIMEYLQSNNFIKIKK